MLVSRSSDEAGELLEDLLERRTRRLGELHEETLGWIRDPAVRMDIRAATVNLLANPRLSFCRYSVIQDALRGVGQAPDLTTYLEEHGIRLTKD